MPGAFEQVLSLRVESSTPLSIGGYDTLVQRRVNGRYIVEDLRPQSLRGVFRWWTRALLAGGLYSLGLNGRLLMDAVSDLSAKIWGGVEGASWLRVIVPEYVYRRANLDRLARTHTRLRLLSLGRQDRFFGDMFVYASGSVSLEKARWSPLDSNQLLLAALSMGVSFVLGCFGKGSRRGLGCFDIDSVESFIPEVHRRLKEASLRDGAARLVGYAYSVARSIGRATYGTGGSRSGLPSIPAVSPGVFRLFECPSNRPPDAMSIVFSRCVTRLYNRQARLWARKNAWILGLPRSQRGSGYFPADREVERRGSPVMFSAHRGVSLMSVFYSMDWPSSIEWSSGRGRSLSIRVDEERVKNATDEAVGDLLSCLSSNGIICSEVKVF